PDDVAYVAFTSGSTGEPKGIVGRHGPLSHFIPWRCRELGLGPDDRYSMLSGLGHDPLHRDLFVPLTTGGTVAVPDPERLGDPGWLAAWLARERVTVAHLTPAMGRLVTSGEPEEAPGEAAARLPDLRRAFFVGEALRRDDLRRLRSVAPAVCCFNHYGATETQQALAVQVVEPDGGAAEEVVPLGAGAGAVRLLVLGPSGALAGVGELGEIAFRSPHLAQGYLDDPAATAERFVPDPYAGAGQGGGRLYRTGDLGRFRPDGAVDFAGRADLQVQVRGFRVELGAVEAALADHPALAAVAVVAGTGPGGTRLAGYYVTAAGAEPPGSDALRRHLADRLPEYMIPAALALLPRLPRTPNGKLDRRALAELGRSGAALEPGAASGAGAPPAAEPPRTPVEEVLAAIWRQVLEVERVGRRDDFFRLGGHSLLATQVVSRVGKALGVELRVRDLFERPTLAGLASRIAERRGERPGQPAPGPGGRPGPAAGARTALLSFGQERLWFLERLGAGGAAYNMPVAFELRGPLDAPALAAALAALARRHEALRTRFESARGEPRQVIAPPEEARLPLALADLSGLGAGRAGREALRLGAAEAALPFDLERRPLARARLLRLAPERHALLLTVHHIVSDGWSLELLLRELATLYGARLRGEPSPLPALPRSFADLARERREALSAERIAGELGFWRRRLAGAPAVLELPLDRPRPRLQSYLGARRWLAVPEGLGRALEALARDHQATRFMTLLAGLQALLWRVTGGQSPPIGTPIAGRDRLESEGVVGFFADTLVLYSDLADDPPFAELLGRAREVTLDAHEHQDLPFEKLVEELRPERNLAHSPLFQVMLVLQNASATPVAFAGLDARPMRVAARTARFDLVLIAGEERGPGRSRLQVKLEYNRDLFDPTTAARLLGQWLTLLGGAAAAPGTPLSELPLLAPAERHQLLREWNDTRSPYPRELRLHQAFMARAARAPDAVALESPGEGGPRRITYGELAARASRLARGLTALGVVPGSRVGIYLGRGPEMVVAVLATLEAGGAYVPLEARWPNDRLRFIVEVEGIRHLLTEASRLPRAAEVAGEPLEHLIALDDPGEAPAPDGARLWSPAALEALGGGAPAPAGADGLAYVIFTSGSTGRPKGVMVRHRPAVNLVHWVNSTFGVGPGDRLLFVTALSFDLSVYDLLGVLAAGATVRIASADEVLDPGRQARILIEEPITFWDSAPAALQQLAPFFPAPGTERGPGPALRLVFLSGDWIPVSLPDRVRAAFAGARVVSLGGATEATVWS
ncbi:MAG TPA: AMP-binding protein, partial [Thermoanaerobaculia bacterium]|nr:AMP-binding protein [Thermoanaerobaculia bacterium]